MSTILVRAAVLAAAWLPALAAAEPISFEQALGLALQHSQAVRAAQAAVRGASASVQAAGQLPDPLLRAGIDNLPVSGTDRWSTAREPMTMKRIGISQEWLSADKRSARENAARAKADREATQQSVGEAEARLQTALAYVDAWYAGAALQLTTQTERHLREEFEAARSRLAAAAGDSAQALERLAAAGIAEDESGAQRQLQAAALVGLQRWIGVLPDALAPLPALRLPAEQDFVAASATVTVLQSALALARQNAALAATDRTPNWTWELSYGQRAGHSDLVSIGVSIPLQIAPSQRQDRDIAAKQAMVEQAEAELAEAQRAATADYRSLAGDAARLQQRIARYQAAVVEPLRQRTLATLAAYRANQSPLSTWFEARHAEVDAQQKLLALQRDLARTQAQLAFKTTLQGIAP